MQFAGVSDDLHLHRRQHIRLRCLRIELVITGIQSGQHLPLAYHIADIHQTLEDFAADTEAQWRLIAGFDFAGIAAIRM